MYTKLLQNLSSRNYIALMLIVALLSWTVALPTLLKAQSHDDISPGPIELQNILSDSAPGMTATHTISFKIATGTTATVDNQVTITYQAEGGLNFDATSVSIVSATVAGGTGTLAINAPSSNATTLVFDITGELVAEDVVTIVAEGIVNPDHTFAESDPLEAVTHLVTFSVSDTGTNVYSNDTRVAIIPAVTMTAAVDTLFTFSVAGLANAVTINGTPTTGSSTPTSLDFGLLAPDTPELLGHELQVSTNASNGFIVTIQETQELTSSLGEKIHRFVDTESGLVGQATPIAWASPVPTLDQYHTYGHYGITTDDSRLDEVTVSTDDQFTALGTGGYIGNFHQEPRVIFGHHGPTNAGTQDTGLVKVGVQIEISSLQPAGDDYTNTLVYVATPTF